MKTPFDSALRVQRRAVDDIRIGLHAEAGKISAVTAACAAIEQRLYREAGIAVADLTIGSFAYANRLRTQRRNLKVEEQQINRRLDALRDFALAASGQLRAIEVAAEDFGNAEMRRERGSEQAEADDLANARLARGSIARSRPAEASPGR